MNRRKVLNGILNKSLFCHDELYKSSQIIATNSNKQPKKNQNTIKKKTNSKFDRFTRASSAVTIISPLFSFFYIYIFFWIFVSKIFWLRFMCGKIAETKKNNNDTHTALVLNSWVWTLFSLFGDLYVSVWAVERAMRSFVIYLIVALLHIIRTKIPF